MREFINRYRELQVLEDFYSRPGFQLLPVYGRRRVGKSRLLREFLRKHRGVYFLCRRVSQKNQLSSLGEVVSEAFGDTFAAGGFRDWNQFFAYLADRCRREQEKPVVVFDEYPYLLSSTAGVSSIFQHAVDERLADLDILMVLAGSHMGMMEREVLGYGAPLYGRRTGQLRVDPLTFPDACRFFPGRSVRDKVAFFSICGGIPAYLEKLDPESSVADNILSHFGREEEFLTQEVEFLLRQELQEVRYYFSIVQAIARGHRRLGLIVNETGLDKALVGKYLRVLSDLRIVEREVPVLEPNPDRSRKGLYRIQDNLFAFYFRFVFPNRHLVGHEGGRTLYERKIGPVFDQFVSLKAEDVARELVVREFPHLHRVGRQWDRHTELDLVGVDADGRVEMVGEVKWRRDKPVGLNVLRELEAGTKRLGIRTEGVRFILFSVSGFTADLRRRGDVLLRGFETAPELDAKE